MEFEVVIKFFPRANDIDDAKNTADAIGRYVYQHYGIDSETVEVIELD